MVGFPFLLRFVMSAEKANKIGFNPRNTEHIHFISNTKIICPTPPFFRLRSLPSDSFRNTKLETLDLSHNEFQVMPNSALSDVSESLRYLNLSHNQIQHLDSTMFSNSLKLISLSLAHNRLTILPDNIFMGLSSLLTLDLSHNPIRANFKELFHYTQRLKELRLSHTSLQTVPSLPLPGRFIFMTSRGHIFLFSVTLP